MQKIIAHRGNLEGPNEQFENDPGYIFDAIKEGFDVEVDVWFDVVNWKDGLWLGHDRPQYPISRDFLYGLREGLWCHCKNVGALYFFQEEYPDMNYFWHQSDDYTLTSHGWVWSYPDKPTLRGAKSIAVMPEWNFTDVSAFTGVCTDYPRRYM